MKKYLFTFIAISIAIASQSQSIIGDTLVCTSQCELYSIVNGNGGPYLWSTDIGLMTDNRGQEVQVCWNEVGSGALSVLDLSGDSGLQRTEIEIEVVLPPTAELYFPDFPICSTQDSLEERPNGDFVALTCETACSGSTVTYFVEGIENDSLYNVVSLIVEGGNYTVDVNERDPVITWGDNGFGSIDIQVTNSAGCTTTNNYCIEILENPDVTIVSSQSGPICTGQEIQLQAISDNAVEYQWSIGDVGFGNESSVNVSFDAGGTYDMQLISLTDCLCSDTTNYIIEVLSVPGAQIDCISTVHVNENQTYFALDECDTYQWSVGPQGTVVEGGAIDDNFIVVNWNDGPYGELSLVNSGCDNTICDITTIELVPVIIPNLQIDGPVEACNEDLTLYSLPLYPGTTYNWTISGNGFIIDGQGTNEITVRWESQQFVDQSAIINVDYENCLLACNGNATLDVDLLSKMNIASFDTEVCRGEFISFDVFSGYSFVDGNWTLTNSDGLEVVSQSNNSFWSFETNFDPGIYTVSMTNQSGDFCNDRVLTTFQIRPLPDPINSIDGPLSVCQGDENIYTIEASVFDGFSFNWTFNDGGSQTNFSGQSAVFTWLSNGPYSITVVAENQRGCESDDFRLDLTPAALTDIIGDSELCIHDTGVYNIMNSDADLEWSIVPEGAGTVFTNDDGAAEVTWHLPGTHTVNLDYCTNTISYSVTVLEGPDFSITFYEALCPETFTTVGITTTATISDVLIFDEDDNEIGTGLDAGPGFYYVEITDDTGCKNRLQMGIDTIKPPVVSLTTPDFEVFCMRNSPLTLYALDSDGGYTYRWFRDGISFGNTAATLSTMDFGSYQVEVTNDKGCSTLSNQLNLIEKCSGPVVDLPICNSIDTIGFEISAQEFCNEVQFENVSSLGHDSSSVRYQFYNPVRGFTTFSNEENPLHIFSDPGFYKVFMSGSVPDQDNAGSFCIDTYFELIEIPIAASFHTVRNCVNEPMDFVSTSAFLPGENIVSYEWDFGDPSSGSDNVSTDAEASHVFSTVGSFLVKLTIESASGCKSRVIEEINVLPNADVDFVLPRNLCAGEALKFITPEGSNLSDIVWTFDDPNATPAQNNVESETAIHFFSIPGTYDVTLEATNIFGCPAAITKSVSVDNNSLTGEIAVSNMAPICEGASTSLTAPTGISYIWSTGETTESIEAFDQGKYTVTVTGGDACSYVPEGVIVEVIPRLSFQISARTFADDFDFEGTEHIESLEICQGQAFDLFTRRNFSWTYSWSILGSTQSFIPFNLLSTLDPDTYDIIVTVTDPTTNCSFDSDPFHLVIHDRPESTVIESDLTDFCEGKPITLSVNNPISGIRYYWNTGEEGERIVVSTSGNYFVTAVNEFGCTTQSNSIFVDPLPDTALFPSGCAEVCFPYDLCLPDLPIGHSIEVFADGNLVTRPISSNTIQLTESGDYIFVVTNNFGCQSTSDLLTLYPEADNHNVSGVVYNDDNQNEIFDGTDTLVSGAIVNLRVGNVIIASVITGVDGAYDFTDIDQRFVIIEVDSTSVPDNINPNSLIYFIEFESCNDQYIQNCALNSDCSMIEVDEELTVCEGGEVEYNGILYPEGHTETFTFLSASGCDSLVNLSVVAIMPPSVSLSSTPSCFQQFNGSLSIDAGSATGLSYSLDASGPFTSDLIFNNLSPGSNDVYVSDSNNCIYIFNAIIGEATEVLFDTIVTPTETGMSNGSFEIVPISTGNYLYSINGGPFTTDLLYSGLAEGTYDLVVIDDNACEYRYTFEITIMDIPQFMITTTETCAGADSGTAELVSSVASGLSMILDGGIAVVDQYEFVGLSAGAHTLTVFDSMGFLVDLTFIINEEQMPNLIFDSNKSCSGQATGGIVIEDLGPDFNYSFNGGVFTSELTYVNIDAGSYMVQAQSQLGCIYDYPLIIEVHDDVVIELVSSNACLGDNNGMIVLEDINNELDISIDAIYYDESDVIENLMVGIYDVFVRDANGCTYQEMISVEESELLDVSFQDYNTDDCAIQSVVLEPIIVSSEDDVEFVWSTGELTPSITVTESNTYNVTISDVCSTMTYTWDLDFNNTENFSIDNIYVPNIFSPASISNIDQSFKPQFRNDIIVNEYSLKIYDRWGGLIEDSSDIDKGWDGYIDNTKASNGVYFWSFELELEMCGESKTLSSMGDITLIN